MISYGCPASGNSCKVTTKRIGILQNCPQLDFDHHFWVINAVSDWFAKADEHAPIPLTTKLSAVLNSEAEMIHTDCGAVLWFSKTRLVNNRCECGHTPRD